MFETKNQSVKNFIEDLDFNTHSYSFKFLFEVKNGNPNGDPAAENRPRCDFETMRGVVTNTCIKYKIKKAIELMNEKYGLDDNMKIFYQHGVALDEKQKEIEKSNNDPIDVILKRDYIDCRMFGYVITGEIDRSKKKSKKKSKKSENVELENMDDETESDNSETCSNRGLRGPVVVEYSESIDPIYCEDFMGTAAVRTEKQLNAADNTFSHTHKVKYGLYKCDININSMEALKSGMTKRDVEILIESIIRIFMEDSTSARNCVLRYFAGFDVKGWAQPYVINRLLKISKNTENSPRCFEDYDVELNTNDCPENIKAVKFDIDFIE